MSDMKTKAKMAVIDQLRKMAQDMMGEDVHDGMKKVSVMSKDKEGLKKGLEMAHEMMDKSPQDVSEENAAHEASESSETEEAEERDEDYEKADDEGHLKSEGNPMSMSDIEKQIAELMKKKSELMKK